MVVPLLRLDRIFLTFGTTPLLDQACLSVEQGARIALVGRNGCGKSTLLKIAAGMIEPSGGEIFRHLRATVRYVAQNPDCSGGEDVHTFVKKGLDYVPDVQWINTLRTNLGFSGTEKLAMLSGGEKRRVSLLRALAAKPDILLLDEPTNHLDLPTIEWLEGALYALPSAIVVISHDRRFLENVTRSTVWLDRGMTKRLEMRFSQFENWRDKALEEEARDQHKLARQIVREEQWLRYGVTARRKRNVRRLGALKELRQQHQTYRGQPGNALLTAAKSHDSGQLVLEAKRIAKSYGDRVIVKDFSLRIQRGDRIGLIGPNGIGKTTLLSALIGKEAVDSGTVKHGYNLSMALLDQQRTINEEETLAHYLTDGRGDSLVINGQERHVVSYMKDFLFLPEQARTPIKELSGGERARLILARLLSRPANFLILDEPTNDLDMETLDLLQEFIADFSGTVLLVSHDRDFLDRTVTHMLAPQGDGQWILYAGGYSDMIAQNKHAALLERKDKKLSQHKMLANPHSREQEKQVSLTNRSVIGREKTTLRKLSYKQVYALEKLPEQIDTLQKEIKTIEQELSDPALYCNDKERFERLSTALEEKKKACAQKEEEWLELELLREDIESEKP
ncbi:ABC-F family ATP-binding cassette domain-containing protein [Bartonella machadoae]|uniref:ABC-F family ATP-binding cassette domain-containing protein n=1 Tax=Bartonella machadoae TaxID=2893471 RepID=UPI001F4CD35A|nr:ABC-F family ATP-binding cassette domain-containing protein [Bartonella machadoae]UNE54038.1 ABC-F family ATP-binding cassette domain-containing protein [Bartonella machadoae]